MKSTLKARVNENLYILSMDMKINNLRSKIWNIIFKEKGDLSDCDVAMALGLVQYELIHHTGEK